MSVSNNEVEDKATDEKPNYKAYSVMCLFYAIIGFIAYLVFKIVRSYFVDYVVTGISEVAELLLLGFSAVLTIASIYFTAKYIKHES